jgi:hypothetical protein
MSESTAAAQGGVRKEACPCCGFLTLDERGEFEICPVCNWEDDGSDSEADSPPGRELTLAAARENFRQFGACARRFMGSVRAPLPQEVP